MKHLSVDELVSSAVHARLLRYLLAAPGGLEERLLNADERIAASELEAARLVTRKGGGTLAIDASHRDVRGIRERIETMSLEFGDDPRDEKQEIEQLLAEHEEIRKLLDFLQHLTGTILKSTNVADLFQIAFTKLSSILPFDIAMGAILEQNVDLYLLRPVGLDSMFEERLVGKLKETLEHQIPISFESTDVVIRGNFDDLPPRTDDRDILSWRAVAMLRQDNRPAGIVALFRASSAFTIEELRIVEILSTQISLVLDNIRAHTQIQSLADTDDLTGIWNKRVFRTRLQAELERSVTYHLALSLMMFDVDDFKLINDRYGHPIGDVVLSELCGTVHETLRAPDLFARFGGDEFVIVLPHTDLLGARKFAERLLQRVRAMNIVSPEDGTKVKFTISIGLASWSGGMTANDVVARADQRLYESKRSGKNCLSW